MVSPFSSTPSSPVAWTGDYRIDSLLWGYKFGTQPTGSPVTITYSFPGAGSVWQSGYDYGRGMPTSPGYRGLNAVEQTAFTSALDAWAEVANITFTEVAETSNNVGDMRVAYGTLTGIYSSFAAIAFLPDGTSDPSKHDIWLDPDSGSWRFSEGSYELDVFIHEIGHTLGLKHPFQGYPTLSGGENSTRYSVMSYTRYDGAGQNTSFSTPMLYDVLAIQQIYGANYSTRAGDTVYTFTVRPGLKTIWDGGGIDTFDCSTLTTPVSINLNAGTFSSIGLKDLDTGGLAVENIAIAFGVTIERARGGGASDLITGNAGNNSLVGNAGNDTLDGQAGNDTLTSGAGNDVLTGGAGNDLFIGGAGNDLIVLTAGFGADRMSDFVRGEDRIDITALGVGSLASFVITAIIGGIRVDIGANSLTLLNILGVDIGDFSGFAGTTTTPTAYDDTLTGTSGNDTINGLAGNDSINGGSGNDSLIGGEGNDTLIGGYGNDTFVAGNGDDSVFGGSEADRYDGGAGQDSITFYDSWLAGTFDLAAGTADFGSGNVRVMTGFEHLTGSWYDDRILGTAGANRLDGGQYGNDTLDGRAGDDTLTGGGGNDALIGGDGNDWLDGGADVNSVAGGAGNDTVIGVQGLDRYDGGIGVDLLDFTSTTASGDFNLANGVANFGVLGTQTMSGFEQLTAGAGNDTIIGTAGANSLQGGSGHDSIDGGGGNDFIFGGAGNDTLVGGDGDDVLGTTTPFGKGNYLIYGGSGNDTVFMYYGADTIFGGAGVDSIDFSKCFVGSGPDDLVLDLSAGQATFSDGFVWKSITEFENVFGTSLDERLIGTNDGNFLDGRGGYDTIIGDGGNDTLLGNWGDDSLDGGLGNDSLDGGTGNDTIVGGAGNDVYVVDAAGDVTTELAGGGLDEVSSSVTRTLGANIENLTLTGAAAISGTGNGLANRITGNGAANNLNGGGGNDTLLGAGGNDSLDGGLGNDTLVGGAGNDTLAGGAGADVFLFQGTNGNDVINGFADTGGAADDVVRILGYGPALDSFADLNISYAGGNATINLSADVPGAGAITLLAISSGIDATDFLFV